MVSRTAAGSCARRRSRRGWAPPRRAGFVRKQGSNGDRQQDRIASRKSTRVGASSVLELLASMNRLVASEHAAPPMQAAAT